MSGHIICNVRLRNVSTCHEREESMTRYPFGSEWRKWDLHLHTPRSDCYQNKAITDDQIIEALSAKEICAAAITDHHFIDIGRIASLQKTAAGKGICIIPGIELRSELGGSDSVHFIGIFPENCPLKRSGWRYRPNARLSQATGQPKALISSSLICLIPVS